MKINVPNEAVLLAGGLGTRLQSTISDRPKPMAEIGGRPFLARVLEQVSGWGVRTVILSVGHMASSITAYFGQRFGEIELRYAHEQE